jgi:hypothetical protein
MKPQQIINLEKKLGFKLNEIQNSDDILDFKKSKTYLLDEQGEVIGLNLAYCKISNISFLQNLSNLISLALSLNRILNISFLQSLSKLTELNLSLNQISDISFLQGLTKLTRLDLRWNEISDISFLQNLPNLTKLDLFHNQISDVSALQGLTNLKELYLCWNKISDISPLLDLKLNILTLSNNPVKNKFAFKNPSTHCWVVYNEKTNLWGCEYKQQKTKEEFIEICKEKDFTEVIEFVENYK